MIFLVTISALISKFDLIYYWMELYLVIVEPVFLIVGLFGRWFGYFISIYIYIYTDQYLGNFMSWKTVYTS